MNAPRFTEQDPIPDPEGAAFEAFLNRHQDRFVTWFFAKLAQRPLMCVTLLRMFRDYEKKHEKKEGSR